MNKIKNLVPAMILMVLSITFLTTYSNNESENIINSNSSQIENSTSFNNYIEEESNIVNIEGIENVNNDIECLDSSTICVNSRYFKSSFSENKSFSLRNTDEFWITSLIVDNKQLLLDEYFDKETIDIFNNKMEKYVELHSNILNNNETYCIKAIDYYDDKSSMYGNLTTEDVLFISSQNYNPVITKVTYIDYDNSNNLPNNFWIETFEQQLEIQYGNKINSPVIIRESWSFTYNNYNIDIVTANNIVADPYNLSLIKKSEVGNQDFPNLENPIAYKMTLIFIDGSLSNMSEDLNYYTRIDNLEHEIFKFPENYENAIGGYYSYQYDENGDIKLYPLYLLHDYTMSAYCYWLSFLFADIDADSNGELVYLYDYGPKFFAHDTITGYELTEKHELHKKLICPKI